MPLRNFWRYFVRLGVSRNVCLVNCCAMCVQKTRGYVLQNTKSRYFFQRRPCMTTFLFLAPIFGDLGWFRMTFGALLAPKIHPKFRSAARNCNWSSLWSPLATKDLVRITLRNFWKRFVRLGVFKMESRNTFLVNFCGTCVQKTRGHALEHKKSQYFFQ